MTIFATIHNAASSTLRNWRLLAVVGIALVLLCMAGTRLSVVRTFGLGIVAVGVGLNLFVILANGGRMPAQMDSVPTDQSDDYEPMGAGTRFACLGDWIEVREWLFSPGDVLLYTGLATAIADRFVGRYWM